MFDTVRNNSPDALELKCLEVRSTEESERERENAWSTKAYLFRVFFRRFGWFHARYSYSWRWWNISSYCSRFATINIGERPNRSRRHHRPHHLPQPSPQMQHNRTRVRPQSRTNVKMASNRQLALSQQWTKSRQRVEQSSQRWPPNVAKRLLSTKRTAYHRRRIAVRVWAWATDGGLCIKQWLLASGCRYGICSYLLLILQIQKCRWKCSTLRRLAARQIGPNLFDCFSAQFSHIHR